MKSEASGINAFVKFTVNCGVQKNEFLERQKF